MYNYQEVKPRIFTEQGQVMFLAIRDRTHQLLKLAGAARMQEIMTATAGDAWHMLACVDRLVELGEIREITNRHDVMGQHRVFVSTS